MVGMIVRLASQRPDASRAISTSCPFLQHRLAWAEKAVVVLPALLHLGIKDIHLGPAFLSPNVAKVLVDDFEIAGIADVEVDIELFMSDAVA
jgi:hydroxylamine reductase